MASIGKAEDWPWKTEAAEAAEAFATDEHEISRKEDKAEELATEGSRSISHGRTRNYTEGSRNREMVILHLLGAKSKGSNGVVAVGLPHRNCSVFKQAAPNKL